LNGTTAKPEPAALMHALRSSPSLHPTMISRDGAPPKYQEAIAMHATAATAATAATQPISCKRGMTTNGDNNNNNNNNDDDDNNYGSQPKSRRCYSPQTAFGTTA
jgi:hypothetical protein